MYFWSNPVTLFLQYKFQIRLIKCVATQTNDVTLNDVSNKILAATPENVHFDVHQAKIQSSLHVRALIRIYTGRILDNQGC